MEELLHKLTLTNLRVEVTPHWVMVFGAPRQIDFLGLYQRVKGVTRLPISLIRDVRFEERTLLKKARLCLPHRYGEEYGIDLPRERDKEAVARKMAETIARLAEALPEDKKGDPTGFRMQMRVNSSRIYDSQPDKGIMTARYDHQKGKLTASVEGEEIEDSALEKMDQQMLALLKKGLCLRVKAGMPESGRGHLFWYELYPEGEEIGPYKPLK